jgi:protein-tyrosine phosphatase
MIRPKPNTDSLNLIVENEGPLNLSVFVGNDDAMNNVNFVLVENEINGILNCAAELRFDNETCAEYFKVGFWDGYGNNTSTLAAAVYVVDQLLTKRHWPWVGYVPRNVLVNCHSGHSRSVVVMSMYLCQKHPETYDWDSALALVMRKRKYPEPPTDGMRELARLLLDAIHQAHGEKATLFSILPPLESA